MWVKTMMFGFAAAGVGGAALTSGSFGGGHDAERVIAKPPAEVYAAIASMAEEGVRETEAGSDTAPLTLEVSKKYGKEVHYRLTVEGKQVASFDLFVAAEKGGEASRVSADIDLDQAALRTLAGPDGEHLPVVPDSLLNIGLSKMLGEMAAAIEEGRSLPAMGPMDMAGWNRSLPSVAERKAAAKAQQEAAYAPTPIEVTGSTEPMVDPNAAAHNYLHPADE